MITLRKTLHILKWILYTLLFWAALGLSIAYIYPNYPSIVFYIVLLLWVVAWLFVFRKFWQKIGFLLAILTLIVCSWVIIHLPPVQNWLVQKVSTTLSKELKTKVSIGHIDFTLFNHMQINDLLVEDQHKDTLLFSGRAEVRISDWFFLHNKIELHYAGLTNTVVNLNRTDSVWNYQFLVDYFSGPKKTTSTDKSGMEFDLKQIELENIRFNQIDKWVGQDMQFSIKKMNLQAELLDLSNKKIKIAALDLTEPLFSQSDYTGKKPPSPTVTKGPEKKTVVPELQWNTDGWQIDIANISLLNGRFINLKETDGPSKAGLFDATDIDFSNISGNLSNLRIFKDTISTNISLSTKERCGLEVKKLQAALKFTPEIMEFKDFLLETPKSRISNYYAMRYKHFIGDMNDFLSRVTIDSRMENSIINSDDLAYFAPELSSWKRIFSVKGMASGTVDNFSAKKMLVQCGNTFIDGDIAMRGLPDINTTFIDFKSNDTRTNYADMVTLIPAIRRIKEPALPKLGSIRFKGNFTGFINDFVAFGNINTALGNIIADINMKLPDRREPSYSGKLSTTGFQLGSFLNNEQLGRVALDGKIKGSSFNLKNINAHFEGKIHGLEFNGYNYQNITVDGTLDKKLFSGHLDIDDPNLKIENLNGTISLENDQAQFNFDALLKEANLKQLHLTVEDFSLKGHFNLDFTGNTIDEFLGTAKVYDAELRHDSTRLSFDSLTVASILLNDAKELSFESNEIKGNLYGQFKIMELPDAFKLFLNRYYPSYIPKPSAHLSDQDFTFYITTKQIDEFVQLVDHKLKGFNNSTFTGSLNLAKNELNLTANVPEMEYDGKIFNNIVMEASGNSNSLLAHITAGDIQLTDSLHLPITKLVVTAQNDVSDIRLTTGANSTISEAVLNAAVHTYADGIKIHFDPSSFILNDKKWLLAKDGELTIRKNFIDANEVKFVHEEQEIVISTSKDEKSGNPNVIARLKKVNINDFTSPFIKQINLDGILTGTLILKDPFGKQLISFQGEAENFSFNGDTLGTVKLITDLNTETGMINIDAHGDGKKNTFSINGHYNYKDSTENQMDLDFLSEHFSLHILSPFLGDVFSDISGDAISTLKLKGGDHKYVTGTVTVNDGSFKIAYTQCRYNFAKQTILFNPDEIDIGTLQLRDTLNNPGTASGKLYHKFFDEFQFDKIHFNTNKMLVLNTSKADNSDFYGKLIGSADLMMDGPLSNLKMNITGKPSESESDSNHIYLPTGTSREAGQIDYIEFTQFGNKMQDELHTREGTNITVVINITANPACKIDVILDEALGDVIKGRGNGNLSILVGTREPLAIRGRYDITAGEYTFNFQTFLKKYFTIRRGSIVWNGDPYKAAINIDADYLAKNVDISNLASSKGYKQKQDMTIISHITGSLVKPIISFDFEFPANSDASTDYITQKKLADFKNDPNEMYKQVASLLLFNTFLSSNQNFLSGSNTISLATNTIGGIVSDMLTNMLNKQLEKATNGILSTYVDINSSLDLQNNTAQLQASVKAGLKILLSKRLVVLVGGNLDYNNPYAQLAKKGLITPDISIEWLLNKDGSLRVVGFNRTSIDLTMGQRNRSGVSLSYHRDYDKISELFKKNRAKNKTIPKVEATKKEPVKVPSL